MGRRGQISIEYVIIMGFAMLITIPLIVIYYEHTNQTNDQVVTSQVDMIARKIVDNAESVYYLGEPSTTSIKVYMPDNVEEAIVYPHEVFFRVRTKGGATEIAQPSTVTLNGSIRVTKGTRYISIESREDYVWITG